MTFEEKEQYYKKHRKCPCCGSRTTFSKTKGCCHDEDEEFKDQTIVWCLCGFFGILDDLIEE